MSTQFAPIWNNASVDFSCIKANVTDTLSGSNSTLLDLQVGGVSRFSVKKNGQLVVPQVSNLSSTTAGDASITNGDYTLFGIRFGGNNKLQIGQWNNRCMGMGLSGTTFYFVMPSDGLLSFSNNNTIGGTQGTGDTVLARDAAGILAQRNDANAQTFRIYNTTDSGIANYERGKLEWSSNVFRIGTEKAGTGSARALELQTDGTTRLTIGTTGDITAAALTLSGDLTISTKNIVTDTTTGTKIGTATTQKLGFYNATPVVQPTAVADATDAASVITQLNALLSRMRDLGLIAT